ncbi:hypothetical protein O181_014180 [Austropuccinia psidii MF-1]|uniref:hAT-like transposase RNase-H fold domain-containing protein n=1 Tax=Austropuccinia psidii MF-1 TaxID=1389203 RepID=A0A9Q3C1D8_9BASI|nr:hypothetical protein [Austropuccinia psidii MF-1]
MALEIKSICPCFCSKDHAVGCMAHTIHLAARDGLKALGSDTGDTSTPVDHNNLNPMAISSLTNPPNGLNLQYNSIIGKISQLASYLCHSPQRREKLITTVNLVYDIDKPTNAKTLLSQVPTRWNSTYKMLNRALDLKDAYNHFCTPDSLAAYRLSHLEWEKAKVMVLFLQPLYEATLLICGSSYPTINQTLPLYILLIEDIRQALEEYNVAPIEPAADAMIQKISKYITIILGKRPVICASILNPRLKHTFFLTHDSTLGEFGTSCTQLTKMFEEEAQKFVTIQDCEPHEIVVERSTRLLDKMYPSATHKGATLELELQRYFSEPPEPKDTDILVFWRS